MSDAVIATTYGTTVDTASVDGTYFTAAAVTEFQGATDLALTKTATVTSQFCGGPQLTLSTNESLNLHITQSAGQVTIHFDLSTILDLDLYKNGVPTHFNAGVAISGDITVKTTTANYCEAVKSACGQIQTSCGQPQIQTYCGQPQTNPCDSGGHITVSCKDFDLSAVTSLYFSDAGSSGFGALILDHNQPTTFSSAVASDGDSSEDAIGTFAGVLAMMRAFGSESSAAEPFRGFTGMDYLMLKVLGGSAAGMSADPSESMALFSTLVATYTGAALALDYAGRALAVAETAPTDLALNAASDGGVKGDGLTNDRTVTIDGQAGAYDSITLYDGTRAVGAASANSAGVFHVTSSSLADGVHSLTAVATDSSGVRVSSDPFSVTVDGKAPDDPVVTGLSGAGLSGTAEAGTQVAIYDNRVLVGTATAGADGHWALARTLTDSWTHSYTVSSTDAAGNIASSDGAAVIREAAGWVNGTWGDDLLVARPGATLTGGYGDDRFVFDADSGRATIADFRHGSDVIEIDDGLASGFADLKAHARQVGYDVVVTFDATHTLTLKSVALSSLGSGDFVFG
jgi:hypothetical protein